MHQMNSTCMWDRGVLSRAPAQKALYSCLLRIEPAGDKDVASPLPMLSQQCLPDVYKETAECVNREAFHATQCRLQLAA